MSPPEPSRPQQRATLVPTEAPEPETTEIERVAKAVGSAVAREAFEQLKKGGNGALWVAVVLLAGFVAVLGGGLYLHVQGDGSVRDKTDRTNRLVVWLVRCEQARQRGEAPPPLPIEEL